MCGIVRENIDAKIMFQDISPNDILYWIDVEGFGNVGEQFLIKELGVLNNATNEIYIHHYKTQQYLREISQNQASFSTKYLHGLSYLDLPDDIEQTESIVLIKKLCLEAKQKNKLIAYKGTAHLYFILKKLNFLDISVNIENFDCCKYVKIVKTQNWIFQLYKSQKCNRHNNFKSSRCCAVKLLVYKKYIENLKHQS